MSIKINFNVHFFKAKLFIQNLAKNTFQKNKYLQKLI